MSQYRLMNGGRIRSIGVAMCLAPALAFGIQVSLNSAALSPASSGIVTVSCTTENHQVSGIQLDLTYDSSAMSVSVLPGSAMRLAAKALYSADISPNQHRLVIVGLNRTPIADGPLLTLVVNVGRTAPAGAYTVSVGNLVATSPAGDTIDISGSSATITVSGQAGDIAPLQSGGVLSAGSLLPGAVVPGEVVTLLGAGIGPEVPVIMQASGGSWPVTASDTSVKFDGVPAPLLYASANQINAVAPYEILGKQATVLTVERGGNQVSSLTLPAVPSVPALFTLDGSGTGQVAASNQDGSINTPVNPASLGSWVILYLTGAGQTDPAGITGRVLGSTEVGRLLLASGASIGGHLAEILYAGPAPELISGVMAVIVRIPSNASPAWATPVVIEIGNAVTPVGLWLSVGPG
ncbi:MAG: hypothetical protein LAO55_16160 [Acidobacteriia bacterium]|nr:hypothetical protein [Terriglobia bacterium]